MKQASATALVLMELSLVRAGVYDLLNSHCASIDRIIFVDDIDQLQQTIHGVHPVILILDYHLMPEKKIDCLDQLMQTARGLPVLIVCEKYPMHIVSGLQRAGMSGCLSFTTAIGEFQETILALLAGKTYFPQDLVRLLFQEEGQRNAPVITQILSKREFEVLCFVARGFTTQAIAREMVLNPKTINTYRYRVFEKLGVDNNVKLTHLALKHGLVDIVI